MRSASQKYAHTHTNSNGFFFVSPKDAVKENPKMLSDLLHQEFVHVKKGDFPRYHGHIYFYVCGMCVACVFDVCVPCLRVSA